MSMNIAKAATFLLLYGAGFDSLASSPGASPWAELSFRTEDGDRVAIAVDNKRNILDRISIQNSRCSGSISAIPVPGVINLNGVEFLEDTGEGGRINILATPFLRVSGGSEETGTLALSIRECRLIANEVY